MTNMGERYCDDGEGIWGLSNPDSYRESKILIHTRNIVLNSYCGFLFFDWSIPIAIGRTELKQNFDSSKKYHFDFQLRGFLFFYCTKLSSHDSYGKNQNFNATTESQSCFNFVQSCFNGCFNLVLRLFQSFSPAVSIFLTGRPRPMRELTPE